jgi:glycine/D-amino acid oxidase-like deaminating enzyme
MLLAQDPHHLEDGVSHLRAIGAQIEAIPQPAQLAPFLGEVQFCRAYFLPEERSCTPGDLLAGFLRGAERGGAKLALNSCVEELLIEKGRIQGVQTTTGRILCDQVVLAAGAWSSMLAARAGLHRPIVPLRRSLFFTGPHPLATADHPWVWVDDVGIYARPFDGGFLLSPCDEEVDWPQAGHSSWGETQVAQRELLSQKLRRYFPGLAQAKLQHSWTGLRSFAPDRRPILGADQEVDGLWWAAGLGGFGLSCSIGVGQALSAWIQGEDTPWLDPRMVSPNRPMASKWLMRPSGHIHEGALIDGATGPSSGRI